MVAVVAIALAMGAYLGVPLPWFATSSSPAGPTLAASPNDDLSYAFLNSQAGWALDSRRDINGDGDFWIFRTDDGARHWQTQFRGKMAAKGANQLTAFDPFHAFAVISAPLQLYRTVDGERWTLLTIPGRAVQEIQFVDPSHGWLLDSEGSATRNTLYVTTDGGNTWNWLGYPPEDATGLAMRDRYFVWMGRQGGSPPQVYFSFNGGTTWVPRQLGSSEGIEGNCLAGVMLLPDEGMLAQRTCEGGTFRGMLVSFDLGDTWSSIPTPPPDSTSWARITYAADFDWWTMTGGTLWKSTDAGRTWTVFSRQHDGWDYIPHAMDVARGWAVLVHLEDPASPSGLAFTSDGGMHWTQVNAPRP